MEWKCLQMMSEWVPCYRISHRHRCHEKLLYCTIKSCRVAWKLFHLQTSHLTTSWKVFHFISFFRNWIKKREIALWMRKKKLQEMFLIYWGLFCVNLIQVPTSSFLSISQFCFQLWVFFCFSSVVVKSLFRCFCLL